MEFSIRNIFLSILSPILIVVALLVFAWEYLFLQDDERVEDSSKLNGFFDAAGFLLLLVGTLPLHILQLSVSLVGLVMRLLLPQRVSQTIVHRAVAAADWLRTTVGWILMSVFVLPPFLVLLPIYKVAWEPLFQKGMFDNFWLWRNSGLYETLDPKEQTIRILALQKGARSEPVTCKLFEADVNTANFEALSYVWGGHLTLRRAINVNDRTFWVTESLYRALRSLRYSDNVRYIWVDQICINQHNTPERNNQVQDKMQRVYENARRVIVWLGSPPVALSTAFEDARRQAKHVRREEADTQELTESNALLPQTDTWHNILDRKWWSRVWIIQEVALNINVVVRCGEEQISWEDFAAYLFRPDNQSLLTGHSKARKLLQFLNTWSNNTAQQSPDLFGVVSWFWDSSATDPRDKIYAFRSLEAKRSPESALLVDVDFGRDHNEVFAEFTATCIGCLGNLRILAFAESDRVRQPSWAVNFAFDGVFDKGPGGRPGFIWGYGRQPTLLSQTAKYNACGSRPARLPEYSKEAKSIKVTGWHIDVVEHTSIVASPFNLQDDVKVWEEFARARAKNRRTAYADFCHTIVGEAWTTDLPSSWSVFFQEGSKALHQRTQAQHGFNEESEIPQSVKFFLFLTAACSNRRFFVTRKGHFGLGPARMLPGYHVCVLEGSAVPCVLRMPPTMTNVRRGTYESAANFDYERPHHFIGQAVVHGMMRYDDDELQSDVDSGRVQLRTIVLQ